MGTRNSFLKLKQPSVKTNFGKKALFYTAPALWNKLSCDLKALHSGPRQQICGKNSITQAKNELQTCLIAC